jgi:L-ascorbate metabolism protein UlaG (beta-lactamase superfamily)
VKVTYYGHSCFAVEINGKTVLFDPFITQNPLAAHIDIKTIKADYILLSHGHNDHVADAEAILKHTDAKLVACYEIVEWYEKKGITNKHPMNIGGSWMFDFGKIKCVNAVHSSKLPDGTYGGNPMGFLIESPDGNFYYAGDTALTYDMKLIGKYKTIQFSFLPIGGNFTMNIDNALIATEFIKCNKVIGMHYDTFADIKINGEEAREHFELAGKELILMKIGETIEL